MRGHRSFAAMWRNLHYQWQTYEAHAQRFGHTYDTGFWENMRFHAFDSFQGLPQVEGDSPSHYAAGVYRTSQDVFLQNLVSQGVDMAMVSVTDGWFDDVLTPRPADVLALEAASVIYIDCDGRLYESAPPIFRFVTPLIQDGTVLTMDDFFRYRGNPSRGVQGAYNEWLAAEPHIGTSELTRCCGNRIAFVCHVG